LRCGRPGSTEVWRDTDCEAGECKYNQRKEPIFVSRVYERRTCLRRESISSSFCLIWTRRYSRLLKGENEHSSSSGEEVDGEGARETTRSSILGEVKKVKGWGAKRTVARVRETSNKNGHHWRGVSAHFGALLGFRPSTIHSCFPDLQRLHMFSPGGK
jgi:hypothetical protein